jgi:hypothetical protein
MKSNKKLLVIKVIKLLTNSWMYARQHALSSAMLSKDTIIKHFFSISFDLRLNSALRYIQTTN